MTVAEAVALGLIAPAEGDGSTDQAVGGAEVEPDGTITNWGLTKDKEYVEEPGVTVSQAAIFLRIVGGT